MPKHLRIDKAEKDAEEGRWHTMDRAAERRRPNVRRVRIVEGRMSRTLWAPPLHG